MASRPIISWQINGKKWKQWQILFSWAPKSLRMVTGTVGSRVRHYWQNGGTAPAPSPHSAGTDPRMKELGLAILTCLFLPSAELTEKEYTKCSVVGWISSWNRRTPWVGELVSVLTNVWCWDVNDRKPVKAVWELSVLSLQLLCKFKYKVNSKVIMTGVILVMLFLSETSRWEF